MTLEQILQQIEAIGYATSVHRMGAYCELHAVPLPAGEPLYLSRVDGETDEDVNVAALELARMCGVKVEPRCED